jgi:hypothetical protein
MNQIQMNMVGQRVRVGLDAEEGLVSPPFFLGFIPFLVSLFPYFKNSKRMSEIPPAFHMLLKMTLDSPPFCKHGL